MIDVTNRAPAQPGRYKLTHANGSVEYVTLERADEPTNAGTPLNRDLFMKLQGMEASKTVFNADGSITATYGTGVLTTTFNADGSITARFVANTGGSIAKTTKFNSDGSIQDEIII